jgi:hypothetical protein
VPTEQCYNLTLGSHDMTALALKEKRKAFLNKDRVRASNRFQ